MASLMSKKSFLFALAISALGASNRCYADLVIFGPTPYLSSADIPANFYLGGSPAALENLEDGTLDFSLAATAAVLGPSGVTDSVDGDDGAIDGSGNGGYSLHGLNISVTYPGLPTAAGLVYTDNPTGIPNAPTTFEVFGPGEVSLGVFGPFNLGDNSDRGTTAEDRFFGFHDPGGILRISVVSLLGGGQEIDHIQYGQMGAIPEPSSLVFCSLMAAAGLTTLVVRAGSTLIVRRAPSETHQSVAN